MAPITIQQTDIPSRSKQSGPCWVTLAVPRGEDPNDTTTVYATTTVTEFDVPVGTVLKVAAKVSLRRATRDETRRRDWAVRVTGDPTDQVVCALGSPQSVEATLTGVLQVESEPS